MSKSGDEKVSRDCIECDGPTCSKRGPSKRCSRCHCSFYCSLECQKKDWKEEHRFYCFPIEQMKEKGVESKRLEDFVDIKEILRDEDVPVDACCPICLESPIERPVMLKICRHAFCSKCLIAYQEHTRKEASTANVGSPCALCRAGSENVELSLLEKAAFLISSATRRNVSGDDKKGILLEALECTEEVMASRTCSILAYFTKAQALLYLDEPDQAAETIQAMREEDQRRKNHPVRVLLRNQGEMGETDSFQETVVQAYEEHGMPLSVLDESCDFEVSMMLSRAYEAGKCWRNAMDSYIQALQNLDGPTSRSPVEQRKLMMGFSHCAYMAGDFDRCIAASDAALDMNRHFPGVHKYKALALQQQGKLDEAIAVMERAVIYETPWDEKNKADVLKLYHELVAASNDLK